MLVWPGVACSGCWFRFSPRGAIALAGMRRLNCLGWFRGQTIGWVEPPSSVADSGVAADEEMGSVCGPPMTAIAFSTLAEKVLEPTRSIKNVIFTIEEYRHA